jgi:hypothetical protein
MRIEVAGMLSLLLPGAGDACCVGFNEAHAQAGLSGGPVHRSFKAVLAERWRYGAQSQSALVRINDGLNRCFMGFGVNESVVRHALSLPVQLLA